MTWNVWRLRNDYLCWEFGLPTSNLLSISGHFNPNLDRGEGIFTPSLDFPSITQKQEKLLSWQFSHPRLQILDRTQTTVFRISGFLINPLQKNCHDSRTSNDIDMKLGPVTKLDKRNTATSKKLDDDVLSANYDAIVIFRFMANLERFRSRISDAWSAEIDKIKEFLVLKGTFSETTCFYIEVP